MGEDVKYIKKKYCCNYCSPENNFEKELKVSTQTGLLMPGQSVQCPQCRNMLPVRSYE